MSTRLIMTTGLLLALALAACGKKENGPSLAEVQAHGDSPAPSRTTGLPATGTEQRLSTQTPPGH